MWGERGTRTKGCVRGRGGAWMGGGGAELSDPTCVRSPFNCQRRLCDTGVVDAVCTRTQCVLTNVGGRGTRTKGCVRCYIRGRGGDGQDIACNGREKMDVKKAPPPFLFLPPPSFSFSSFSFSSSLLFSFLAPQHQKIAILLRNEMVEMVEILI